MSDGYKRKEWCKYASPNWLTAAMIALHTNDRVASERVLVVVLFRRRKHNNTTHEPQKPAGQSEQNIEKLVEVRFPPNFQPSVSTLVC